MQRRQQRTFQEMMERVMCRREDATEDREVRQRETTCQECPVGDRNFVLQPAHVPHILRIKAGGCWLRGGMFSMGFGVFVMFVMMFSMVIMMRGMSMIIMPVTVTMRVFM